MLPNALRSGGGGHLRLIVMHLSKAYARSITTDIDRLTGYF